MNAPRPVISNKSDRQTATVWRPYCQMKTAMPPLRIVATQGCELVLDDGRRLIDGLASWWSACHGYNDPHVADAVRSQLNQMPHVMFGGLTHEPAERLAKRLAAVLPGDLNHVFFSDSGSVAIEVAMKMAIGYWQRRGQPGRTRFVSFQNAYHGDTTGAMSLCDPKTGMHGCCTGAIPRQLQSPLPVNDASTQCFHDRLDHHDGELAAVIVEPLVQGAGGMRFHDAATLQRIDAACRERGLLWIADEIATGFGRTGTMFALDQIAVVPDIVCLGKALTAGTMTMAVTVAGHRVFDAFLSDRSSDALMHGPTFMANPLACAAANASLDLFESQPRLEQVEKIESILRTELEPCRGLPGVVDVRCRGAIGVVELRSLEMASGYRDRLMEHGVWLRPLGNCLYTTPALTIAPEQLRRITRAMVDMAHS